MILDVNLLLYAADDQSPYHPAARSWLEEALTSGDERVGFPWQTIGGFVRMTTNWRVYAEPWQPAEAWGVVRGWLGRPSTWIPPATERTASVFGRLLERHEPTGKLVPDAQLAAIAIENGAVLYSADSDFARFDELRWENPLRGR